MISVIKAIILGVVQGLTEFLPVSSSGHLVLFQSFLNIGGNSFFLDVMLHFGTLIAVALFFREDIWKLIKVVPLLFCVSRYRESLRENSYFHLLCLIIIGTIPTLIIGLAFKELFKSLFQSPLIISFTLALTGLMLFSADRVKKTTRKMKEMTFGESFLIGVAQGLAITPGISRSGSTISTALWRRISPEDAGRFSFLLSLPAILGANLLEAKDVWGQVPAGELKVIAIGTLVAFLSGLAALKLLMFMLQKQRLRYFAYYCWSVSVLGLLLFSLGYL